jgi:putative heme-binding domain-containing protein
MHAGGSVLSKMNYDLPLEATDMVGVRPTQGTFGIHAAQVIARGDPFRSVLLYRMSKVGQGRMPHIGSTDVDLEGVALIRDWIEHMPQGPSLDTAGTRLAAQLRAEESARVERLRAAEQLSSGQLELVERLLSSTSGALMLLRSIDNGALRRQTAALVIGKATEHDNVSVRDLFERFLPVEKRTKRLGSIVQPGQILSLPGDVTRGEHVVFNTAGVQCKNCHRIGKNGHDVGPELTTIGQKYSRAQLLESMLWPSKLIDPKYVTYLVETNDGRLLTGLLVKRDEQEVVLKDAQNKVIRISSGQIEHLVPQRLSLMPELLLRDMTAQQVADLLAYLSSLK